MTIKELIETGHRKLIQFDSARLDAELLLSHVLGKPVTYLLAYNEKPVSFLKQWEYLLLVAKRRKGIPAAYLLGHKEFYNLDFQVNKHVLVPRPDTETLVESVIEYLSPGDLLLDIGTGSGCIPISVLKNVHDIKAVATDISYAALKVAKLNIETHHLSGRIQVFQSDLLKNIPPEVLEDRNLVVTANLPYVPKGYEVNIETTFEPQIALWGGDDGLDIFKRLLEVLLPLRPKAMFFECFGFQKAMLAEHAEGYELRHFKSPTGGAGVMVLEKK